MPSWIAENLSWIFSGIGIAVLGAIAAMIKYLIRSNQIISDDKKVSSQDISIVGNVTAQRDIKIQQIKGDIIKILTDGIDKKSFNRFQSENKKDRGRDKVQEWGQKMNSLGEWDWHLLGQALEHYFDAVRADPEHQHPWTNVSYVFYLIGDKHNANRCLQKSKNLASPGPNYPGRNYKQVANAIENNSYLTGGVIRRPEVPQWFIERFGQYLSNKLNERAHS